MRKGTVYILVILPLLTGCSFYGNVLDYKELCNATIENIVKEDYDAILKALNVDPADSTKAEQTITAIKEFRRILVEHFGTDFDTWFVSANKKYSSKGDEPDITTVQIQVENEAYYSVITFTINDSNGSIQNVHLADEIRQIPSFTLFWLFGILPLTVLVFNIISIRKVLKSTLTRKWAFVLLCVLLNTPSIDWFFDWPQLSFTADLSFKMLFGVSFNFMGYDNYAMGFGLPIGAFITQLVIYRQERKTEKLLQTNIVE